MKKSAFSLMCAVLVALPAGCHSVRRGEPIVGPMQLNSKEESGRIVFEQRCHQCHPYGEAGLGPALNNKPAPVFLMKTQVRLGLGAMPRFDEHVISKQQLDDLMAYVMALRNADKDAKSDKAEIEQKEEKSERRADTPDQPARRTK
jgi:mono/diheme cytochrome c family protein